MKSPPRYIWPCLAALLLASAVALAASGEENPFRRYLEEHPGVAEDELIGLTAGDPADRVLAVVHHPDLGVDPLGVDLLRIEGAGTVALDVGDVLSGRAPAGDLFIAVRQRCRGGRAGPEAPAFDSWFYLPAGRLQAWILQPFGSGCRPEEPLVEASDHAVMRRVGQAVFRPLGKGNFRYGPLAYQEWDDAFAAPTSVAMLSHLETSVAARPDDARAYNRLGVGLFAVGERERAVEALRSAAELAPGWSLPYRNLAAAHRHRGDFAAASLEHQRADEIDRTAVGAGPPGSR